MIVHEQITFSGITTQQKINFFEFCLAVFTGKIKKKIVSYKFQKLRDFGFCLLYVKFFSESPNDLILLPELLKYKPKIFYDIDNKRSEIPKFWFPLSGKQTERIDICKKILIELKSEIKL